MVTSASPIAQLRDFIVDRFPDSGELEGFVEDYFPGLGPHIAWEGTLANQARELTSALVSRGLLDQLWPALRSVRPAFAQDVDRLAGLDWTSRTRIDPPSPVMSTRWLVGAAAAVGLAIVIGVVAFNGSGGSADPTAPTETTQSAAAGETVQTTTMSTTLPETTTATPTEPGPPLQVSSIRAINGSEPAEQSAIQMFVRNTSSVAVNVDRVTFTINKTGTADCKILGFTGFGSFFARGADLEAYSVPIYDYANSADAAGSLIINPARRFEADGEETLLMFDLDASTAPEGDVSPPYFDERFLLDGEEQVGFTAFEIHVQLETTDGETVDAGTVVVAHPRLLPGLFTVEDIPATCGWEDGEVSSDGPGSVSSKVQDNLSEIVQFCESPVARGLIGGNEQMDSLLHDVVGCS